ncbi:MAG: proton-conducting transporter membrane subunit [Nannocystales bacterium]
MTSSLLALLAPAAPAALAPLEPLGQGAQTLADLMHLAPMMIIALWALLDLAADAYSGPGTRAFERPLSLAGLGFAVVAVAMQLGDPAYDAGIEVFSGFLVVDHFALLLDAAVIGVVAATVLFAGDFARSHRFEYGEQEALLFIATFGVMVLNHANTLLAVFLGIETMSIAVYVMVGARWNSKRSSEAALKYFIMGAFASGLLVMGIALIYGATGTVSLPEIGGRISPLFTGKGSWGAAMPEVIGLHQGMAGAAANAAQDRAIVAFAPIALLIPGILLTTGALLFKISAVPFHMWTPDAYDGAPTPTTAFMASAVKIGGFAVLLKFLVVTLQTSRLVHHPYGWATIVGVIAIATMSVGNLAALRQTNVKRMLAYSSVAHVGYLLIGVIAAAFFYVDKAGGQLTEVDQLLWARGNGNLALASVLYYLVTYSIATMGTFACVAFYGANKKEATGIHEWAGMGRRHPGIALGMTICLLSLMGMPPVAGFFGKLGLFRVAMTSGDPFLRWMVIIGVVNSVVGAAYYLRVIVAMYFRKPPETEVEVLAGGGVRTVVVLAAALSIAAGVGARPLMDLCRIAAAGTGHRVGGEFRRQEVQTVRDAIEARGAKPEPEAEEPDPEAKEPDPEAEEPAAATPAAVDAPNGKAKPSQDAEPQPAAKANPKADAKAKAKAKQPSEVPPAAGKEAPKPGGPAKPGDAPAPEKGGKPTVPAAVGGDAKPPAP